MDSTSLRARFLALVIAALAGVSSLRGQVEMFGSAGAVTVVDDIPAHEVTGRVELGIAEADLAARLAADSWARRHAALRAEAVESGRGGLPEPVERLVRDAWLRDLGSESLYSVLGRNMESREHRGYRSHQSTWTVAPDEQALRLAIEDLVARLERVGRRFQGILVATPFFWGLLVLLHGWFDRVTRGYMPWRGRVACVLMALAGPAAALAWGCL